MRKLLFISFLLIISCNNKSKNEYYLGDNNISNSSGQPKDTLVYYLPSSIAKTKISIDSFSLKYSSMILFSAKEPILYNSYLEKEIYRFTYFPSFNVPIVFSISKKNNEITFTTKKIEQNVYNRKAKIIYKKMTKLSLKEWNEFENLINNCSFWDLKPSIKDAGLDGSVWIIEGHKENKYWYVKRWSPKNNFEKVGRYLIDKSRVFKKNN